MGSAPPNITVKRNFEQVSNAIFKLKLFKCFNMLPRLLDLLYVIELKLDSIVIVTNLDCKSAAITSREPFNTQLSGRDGSYSQIAVAISMAAIFVICVITSTSARLTT